MSAVLCLWNDPVSGEDGHNVYLLKNGVFGKHNTSLITLNQYKITNLNPGTYSAYATTVLGSNESNPSNVANFTIVFGDSYKPSNLQSIVTGSDVDFSWDYVAGVTQFNMYLETGGSYVKQNSSPLNIPEISLTGLSPGTYNWKVSSLYDGQEVESDVEQFTIV